MNRHIITTTIVISFFALCACNLSCDSNESKNPYSDSDLNCEGGRLDPTTDLCWQHPKASGAYEWQKAMDYCDDLDLAGHTDWYLPSRDDLIGLLGGCDSNVMNEEFGYCDSCEEGETCSALFDSDGDWHWSSSTYGSYRAWRIGFRFGYVDYYNVSSGKYVRCVRPGP